MARYPQEHKQSTRQKIVNAASRALREEGVAGATVPGIMARVGLTQGGFYAHFENKDALVAEASAQALASATERTLERGRKAPPGTGLAAIVTKYLSVEHRDNVAGGCPLPAISGELGRAPAAMRGGYTQALRDLLDGLAPFVSEPAKERFDDAEMALVATMVGGLLLSRAVDDPELSERIINSAREVCLRSFGEAAGSEFKDGK